MHTLDIFNYLTPRYLAELIDNNEYHINLRNYGEMYDSDLSITLETIHLEIGLQQIGLQPEIILKLKKSNYFQYNLRWKSTLS